MNGAAVKVVFDTIKDLDPQGLRPKMSFGPDRRQGVAAMRILKMDFKAKTWRPETGWLESPSSYGPKGEVVFK